MFVTVNVRIFIFPLRHYVRAATTKAFFCQHRCFFSRNSTKHNFLKVFVPLWYNSKLFHTDWLLSVHCFSISTHVPRTWSIQDILAMTKLEVKKFQKLKLSPPLLLQFLKTYLFCIFFTKLTCLLLFEGHCHGDFYVWSEKCAEI